MYRNGMRYKLKTLEGIFYTCTVIDEDEINLKIHTIRDETVILNKKDIAWSRELK